MATDWSGVACNRNGWPLGYVRLTLSAPPGVPVYVTADSLTGLHEDGPNTSVPYGAARVVVRENIRLVLQWAQEANTVEIAPAPPPPPVIFPAAETVPVRKKSRA